MSPSTWTWLSEAKIALGTMYFGSTVAEEQARRILDRYVERGGRLIDTANCYSFWVEDGTGEESERVIGRWLADRGIRDEVVLATKVGSRPEPAGAPWPQHAEGLTGRVIREQVHHSLDRLGCDRLDLYLAHIDDPVTDLSETLGTFAELVGEGVVDVLGCSNLTTARLQAARELATQHGWPRYQVVQQRYSYLSPRPDAEISPQHAVDEELLNYATTQADLVVQGYSPLLSGAYTRPDRAIPAEYQAADTRSRLAALHGLSARLGVTANQIVLAWMLAGRQPVVPVVGVSSPAQLDEAMDALALTLDTAMTKTLDMAGL